NQPLIRVVSFRREYIGEIIGGKNAKPHSRPYMAYLSSGGQPQGALPHPCHCESDRQVPTPHLTYAPAIDAPWVALGFYSKITVKLGAHNISEQEQSQQEIPVHRQILHPQYDKETTNNDIMLLQLAETVKLNKWVKTIPLPRTNKRVKPGTKCSVAGWGRTSRQSKLAPATTLQEANLKVLKDDVCLKNPDVTYYDYDASTMMCVGDLKKGKASFMGDSGGPLVCGKRAQGIVSWGSQRSASPGVYTRVSTFIPWIEKMMRMLEP
uniref:Peptidase S1 domain-containing protein n=1 Tax=Gopherus agassizii TaxID=38772 RepID=A0A452IG23_9SAUR